MQNSNSIKLIYLGEVPDYICEQDSHMLQTEMYCCYQDAYTFLSEFYLDIFDFESIVIIGNFLNEKNNAQELVLKNLEILFDLDELIVEPFGKYQTSEVVCVKCSGCKLYIVSRAHDVKNSFINIMAGNTSTGVTKPEHTKQAVEEKTQIHSVDSIHEAIDISEDIKQYLEAAASGFVNTNTILKEKQRKGNAQPEHQSKSSHNAEALVENYDIPDKNANAGDNTKSILGNLSDFISGKKSGSKKKSKRNRKEKKDVQNKNGANSTNAVKESKHNATHRKRTKDSIQETGFDIFNETVQRKSPSKKPVSLKIRYGILFLCIAAFLFSGGYLLYYQFIEPDMVKNENNKLIEMYINSADNSTNTESDSNDTDAKGGSSADGGLASGNNTGDNSMIGIDGNNSIPATEGNREYNGEADSQYTPENDLGAFTQLFEANSDVIGWVEIPGTQINYPVVQADNNDFYLDHNFYKYYSRYGAIFADYESVITSNYTSSNVSIYGHNMLNGTMFGELKKYKKIDYLKGNPTFTFNSLYSEDKYVIFSVFITNTNPSHDNGQVFEWRTTEFGGESDFDLFISECRQRSLYDIPVDVGYGDKLVSLTTCSYEFDDARLVVLGRKIRNSETINMSNATQSPAPLYPQVWYDMNSGN